MSTSDSTFFRQTQLDSDFTNFIGYYIVEPGQYQHLDGQYVELTRNQLRFIIDSPTSGSHTFLYSVSRIRFLQDPNTMARANVVALTITNASRIHSQGNTQASHQVEQLLDDILGVRAPTIMYLTFDEQSNYYSLKNHNYATIAVLQRVDSLN